MIAGADEAILKWWYFLITVIFFKFRAKKLVQLSGQSHCHLSKPPICAMDCRLHTRMVLISDNVVN